jgi:uncharacterized protein (TIGR02145 family)
MKKIFTLIMLCGIITGYAQITPRYAVSSRTWRIEGNGVSQTWSDHINVPACDKTDFDGGTNDAPRADCRDNPNYNDLYLYSWQYVNQNASTLCPAPWRVPTKDDFIALDKVLGGTGSWNLNKALVEKYINNWGGVYGGSISSSPFGYPGSYASYWSSTRLNSSYAYSLNFHTNGYVYPQKFYNQHFGFLLRCVK